MNHNVKYLGERKILVTSKVIALVLVFMLITHPLAEIINFILFHWKPSIFCFGI